MCGIVGLYYKDQQTHVAESTIHNMCRSIIHRGPDDEGVYIDGHVGIGMRRLSVIDLASGHQPMFNSNQTVSVVYNGEIYNYKHLRVELEQIGYQFQTESDTEVLVHGYEAWGAGLCAKLNGMFAFSIWDSERRELMLARDQIGIKPLYLYEDDGVLAWASEVKALLTLSYIALN